MSYRVEMLPQERAILATCHANFQLADELSQMVSAISAFAEAEPAPITLIADMRGVAWRLDDMIIGANRARSNQDSVFRHPKIKGIIFISDSKLVELSARGLSNPIFGGHSVRVVESLEQALESLSAGQA